MNTFFILWSDNVGTDTSFKTLLWHTVHLLVHQALVFVTGYRLPPSVLLSSHTGWWYFSMSVIFIVIDLQWSLEIFLAWLLGPVTFFVKVASVELIPSACRCYFFHVPPHFFFGVPVISSATTFIIDLIYCTNFWNFFIFMSLLE